MMKKLLNLTMITLVTLQITSPLILNASEILSETIISSEVGAEVTDDSEITNQAIVSSEVDNVVTSEVESEISASPEPAERVATNSEISSEASLKSEQNLDVEDDKSLEAEIVSDDFFDDNYLDSENSAAAPIFTDFSGIGNQNLSDIGKSTFIPPREETEDRLKTIAEMSAVDSSKFKSVTDLDQNLIDSAVAGEVITESIMFNEYDGMTNSEINANLAGNTTWSGSCWEPSGSNQREIVTNVVQSDICDVTVTDYGYYYNLEDMTYEPIDLTLSIDFVDFFNSPLEADPGDVKLTVALDYRGIAFTNARTNELEFSTEFTTKSGTVVNVPTFYELTDVDGGSAIGFAKEDLLGVTTYYQDESNPTSGDYEMPAYVEGSAFTSDQSVFNYESFYDHVISHRDNGDITQYQVDVGTYLRDNDRSIYNSIDPTIDGDGTYTAADRGWNRIKFYEEGDYITILDSWGANSGNGGTYYLQPFYWLISNGKDSRFVVEMNSSTTMTSNLQDEFLGYSPTESGLGQGWTMKPYTFVGETIVSKEVTDASGDGIAQRGEELTYNISLKNISSSGTIDNVPVRDSMLEAIESGAIDYLSWDGNYTITDVTNGTTITGSGNLGNGSFTIDSIPSMTDVQISFTVTVLDIPEDILSIDNVVTDNGTDPKEQCDSTTSNIDCDGTETPVEQTGNTVIQKSVTDEDGDGIIRGGEVVEYTVTVTNDTALPVYTTEIKDSMLEETPDWLSFNDDEAIVTNPTDMLVSGSLAGGDLFVDTFNPGDSISITYSLTADRPLPEDLVEVKNVATDDGIDPIDAETGLPIICSKGDAQLDCAETITPVQPDGVIVDPLEAETIIEKTVVDENGDGIVEENETLTYTIEVTNLEDIDAHDVVVRDSMLEDIPSWLVFNNDITTNPSDIEGSGSLEAGGLIFDVIEAGQTVTIRYSVTAKDQIPTDITNLVNSATDNGENPIDPDTELPIVCAADSQDCATTTTPLAGDTIIEKSVVDASEDGIVEKDETLTYTITVTNNTENDAHNVVVRDSMLEELAMWLVFNDDVTINPSDIEVSGSLEAGDLTFDVIEAGQSITISYSVTANGEIPVDITNLINSATDNGDNPIDPDTGLPIACASDSQDCATTTTPLEGDTEIKKYVIDEDEDGIVEESEILTYGLLVTNNTVNDAYNVVVRDSMLEELPSWLIFNDDLTIIPSDIGVSGSLETGDLTFDVIEAGQSVMITYSVTANGQIPEDITSLTNTATDNGDNPIDPDTGLPIACASDSQDCATTTTPLAGNTIIEKAVVDGSGEGLLQSGETLTYTLTVTNNTVNDAYNVVVRDSMLEETPTGLVFNNDVTITPSDIEVSGSLEDGDLTFDVIEAGQSVVITYSLTAAQPLPEDLLEVTNVATDNGDNPIDPDTGLPIVCTNELVGLDCDEVTILVDHDEPIIDPLEAETVIKKSIVDENGDGIVEKFETLTYTIEVINPEAIDAHNVVVRDSMLEDTPTWLTFNNDVTIEPNDIEASGSLEESGLILSKVEAGQTVTITYSLTTTADLPSNITSLINVATDNGDNPIDPDTNIPITCDEDSEDCAVTTSPLAGDTVIEKAVVDASGDGLLQSGEELTYTVTITNNTVNDAYNVVVRDSMVEDAPTWLLFNDDLTINPSEIGISGSLEDGDLMFDVIEAGETVTIAYSLKADHPLPENLTEVKNIATDDGSDPIACIDDSEDCAEVTVPVDQNVPIIDPTNGDTIISKSVVDDSGDGVLQGGETLVYSLTITNPTNSPAHAVAVRDSMLEAIPSWLTFNNDVEISPRTINYSGNLTAGDFTIAEIKAGQTVTITYSLTAAHELPLDVANVINVATDNGVSPIDPDTNSPIVCDEDGEDCAGTTTPLAGDTVIEKSVVDTNGDGIAQESETLAYTLQITNNTINPAYNVEVRDNMLEETPRWLTFNDDITIDPSDLKYSGSLTTGDLMITEVKPGQTITISYSVTLDADLPNKVDEIENIAIDNGQDPTIIDPDTCEVDTDCASTETPVEKDDKTLAITGGKAQVLLIELVLILIASFILKRKLI